MYGRPNLLDMHSRPNGGRAAVAFSKLTLLSFKSYTSWFKTTGFYVTINNVVGPIIGHK